ncbi:adenylate/guanylate cyclase domain-containing protein [Ramlibacter sp.]|uniref:adenylate/guanylate cyclase domain-containing protein n=1 Tax=Ramlibacter sp. TaxID=1917967 RepID=UPI003D0E0FA9
MGASSVLDARIAGSFRQRLAQELLRNSAQFPIANLLLEMLLEGPRILLAPDMYVLVAAALLQAWVLTQRGDTRPVNRLLGNLVGPAFYAGVEFALEGPAFFAAPNHVAYLGYGAAIGLLQYGQRAAGPRAAAALVVLEHVAKASILFIMYAIFEVLTGNRPFSWPVFLSDPSHVFMGLATLLLGLSSGLEAWSARSYLALLRSTSTQLQRYSEWLFGTELLERAIEDPAALSLARRERSVLFMDVRGFTAWSEGCAPETVVQALNAYYAAAEPVLRRHAAIKLKFSADEVLAVFDAPATAVACARELRARARDALSLWGLHAGIGLHAGPVVEGLLGSEGLKAYDVIGDTVNTAKRIEGAAGGGEILVSGVMLRQLAGAWAVGPRRDLVAKGKAAPLEVYPLAEPAAH